MKQGSSSRWVQNRLRLFGAGWRIRANALWTSPRLQELYPELLKEVYDVIRASLSVMDCARTQALMHVEEGVCGPLATYLAQHMQEEQGHDSWVLEDLDRLGVPRGDLFNRTPSSHAASIVGAQHYWAMHAHPVTILGYIAVLEGDPPQEAFFDEVSDRTGIPLDAFSTYRYHARIDQHHRDELFELFDVLPLQEHHLRMLGVSILQTCHGMERMLTDLLERPSGMKS